MIDLPQGLTLPEGLDPAAITAIQISENDKVASYQLVSLNTDGSVRRDAVVTIKRFD